VSLEATSMLDGGDISIAWAQQPGRFACIARVNEKDEAMRDTSYHKHQRWLAAISETTTLKYLTRSHTGYILPKIQGLP